MRAAYIDETGPPEVIKVGELPRPEPGPGQVLVKVTATALNPIDLYLRSGLIPMPLAFPYVIGCDLAGTVEKLGLGSGRFKVGDRVWGSNQGLLGRQGTTAEFAAVDEAWLYPTPGNLTDNEAAAMALVGITAHLGLFRFGQLKSGESAYVPGGSGGVGSIAIQMARAAGARVATTAGSPERTELCRKLGANLALNYKTDDVPARLREFAPEGVDVWCETQREPNLEVAIPLLRKHGRLILMAGRTAKPALPLGAFYPRNCSIFGFAVFNSTAEEQRHCATEMVRFIEKGSLKPLIGRVFSLSQAAEAQKFLDENTLKGGGFFDRESCDHNPITNQVYDMNLLNTYAGSMMEGFLPRGWDLARIDACCSNPPETIADRQPWWHSGFELVPCESVADFDVMMGHEIAMAIKRSRDAGRKAALILPVGPMGMYRWAVYFLKEWKVACDHVFGFNMDEWSDRDGKTLAPEDPGAFQNAMQAAFYGPLGPLTVPRENRWFATADRLPLYAGRIADLKANGAELIVIFGIGRVCHIAFWEPHFADEFASLSEWKAQTHRIGARLHPLTIEQNALTSFKSRMTLVPAFANTIGPGLFLEADRIIGGAEGVFDRGMQWQGASLWMTLRYGPDPWVPSSFMPTLPGRLFYHRGLAGPLEPEMN